MYDIEASFDQQILSVPRNRPTIVFVEALDPRIIEAACHLTRFCRPVFLAPEEEVLDVIERDLRHVDRNRIEYAMSESAFVDVAERDDLVDEFARGYQEHCPDGGRTPGLDEGRG